MPKRQPGQQTKNERLVRVFDAYYVLGGRKPVSMDDVVAWAMLCDLLPVPAMRDPPEVIAAWEQRLEQAKQPVEANS